eukprot:CAMPEP_0204124514 /NCGR_PEP_ID=MMETSP0361-20130328/9890_1 /ASSEMBLY_ACC=CAM_ASM_000343 /TAXON_ID=268821 /ORGANISM="Scrippsiella Hangoei, Strain SHTV-5" /LENGTH=785 /DNA_ID=CAMNT_0051076081 /DNA_START=29 /DNA_END=2386 /DNA_ORIENTATION=-
MDLPWAPAAAAYDCDDVQPPWVQFSQMRTRQEICCRRFLRFAGLPHVHGAFALASAALWFSGIHPLLAWAPSVYFTGFAGSFVCSKGLAACGLEGLSHAVLGLDAINALHLALLCALQGDKVLGSPTFALVPLVRTLFGFLVHEVHCHLALSTALTVSVFLTNPGLFAGNGLLLIVVATLLLELTAVVVLSEGPCGYEEALIHLAQCRSQHQVLRSEALQRIDIEWEKFSGRLLAVATEGVAELTDAVHRASEPVLQMLKSSCATGTKSAREAERIGRIGEGLRAKVSDILRFKNQATWTQLQGHAKARAQWLREHAADHQSAVDALLSSLREGMGATLAQMHELELEAEASLDQVVQSEISRALETADARMDLVRQSAQAMEQRISDTVEVLLSLLRYFGSKGHMAPRAAVLAEGYSESRRRSRGEKLDGGERQGKLGRAAMPAISERLATVGEGEESPKSAGSLEELPKFVCRSLGGSGPGRSCSSDSSGSTESLDDTTGTASADGDGEGSETSSALAEELEPSSGTPATTAALSEASEAFSEVTTVSEDLASDSDVATTAASASSRPPSPAAAAVPVPAASAPEASMAAGVPSGASSATGVQAEAARPKVPMHPLFTTRLSYETEHFFWSWASSKDLRAEADALRAWQRASATSTTVAEERPAIGTSSGAGAAAPLVAAPPRSSALRAVAERGVGAVAALASSAAALGEDPVVALRPLRWPARSAVAARSMSEASAALRFVAGTALPEGVFVDLSGADLSAPRRASPRARISRDDGMDMRES